MKRTRDHFKLTIVTYLALTAASIAVVCLFVPAGVAAPRIPLGAALALYVASHILRVLRLMALAVDDPGGTYLIAPAHLITAPLGLFLPFKIGELFRIFALMCAFERFKKGLLIWGFERIGDIFVLICAAILLLLTNRSTAFGAGSLLLILAAAAVLVLLVFWAIFDLSGFLIEVLVLKSRSDLGYGILKQLSDLRNLTKLLFRQLSGRWLTLFVSSVLIWICEILAFVVMANGEAVSQMLDPASAASLAYGNLAGRGQVFVLALGIGALIFAANRKISHPKDVKWNQITS